MMLNTSNVAHSILAEEVDNCNSNNNNNNSLLLNDLSFHTDDLITNGSLHYGVYDTTLFDVLKVDPEDFAVSKKKRRNRLFATIDRRLIEQT